MICKFCELFWETMPLVGPFSMFIIIAGLSFIWKGFKDVCDELESVGWENSSELATYRGSDSCPDPQ